MKREGERDLEWGVEVRECEERGESGRVRRKSESGECEGGVGAGKESGK